MKVLGLIPARADSDGCKGKNLRVLGSKHILQWTIDAAVAAGLTERDLVLSTEDGTLLLYGQMRGLRTIDQGARTDKPTAIIDQVLRYWQPDILVYLQPTTPFKRPEHIKQAIANIESGEFNSTFTAVPIPAHYHPYNSFMEFPDGEALCQDGPLPKRQDLPPMYARDGGVYAFKVSEYLKLRDIYCRPCRIIKTDPLERCNIDSEDDWLEAQWRAEEIERVHGQSLSMQHVQADGVY